MELKFINFNKVYSLAISDESYIVGEIDFNNSSNGTLKVKYPILIRDIFAFDLTENKANGFTNIRRLNGYGKDDYTFISQSNIISMERANLLCKLIYFDFCYSYKKEENIFIERDSLTEEELESICIKKKDSIITKLNKLLKLG